MATRTAGEEGGLTPRRLRAAQRSFTLFAFLNMISFQLLTGNVIALYALRLEAGEPLIGVLYSFMPLAYLLPLLGRAVVRRMGTVRTMAVFWILRQLLMVPLLFAPLAAARGRPEIGIWLILISVVGFNLARGIAMTSFNAVVGAITAPAERGSFLARVQLVSHLGAIAAGLAMGLLLQQRSPLFLFTLVLSLGVVTGLLAARELFRLPEPAALAPRGSFGPALRDAFRRRGFPRFVVVLALNSFVTAMALPFLLVYVKRVHGLGDNTAILLAAVGSVGAIVMALVSSFVIDRVGASPLLPLFNIVVTVTMLLVVAAPPLAGSGAAWIYLGAIFFFATFAAFGTENTHSVYYLSLIRAEERLNLGIFDLVVIGLGAMLGSLAGGAALGRLASLPALETADAYRIYYGGMVVAYTVILLLTMRLDRLGAVSFPNVLGIFVSPRQLRALALLHRLKASRTPAAAEYLIQRLGEVRSDLAAPDLLRGLRSPRFTVRSEALDALSEVPLNDAARAALIAEVEEQPFTTAYQAAELIGRREMREAVPALRRGLESDDVFLAGKCMVALARLGDEASLATVERMYQETGNPRLLIHGAAALELFGRPASLATLLGPLERNPTPFARDEIILAAAGILRIADTFYPLYQEFLAEPRHGLALLSDFLEERQELQPRAAVAPAGHAEVTALARLVDAPGAFPEAAERALAATPVAVEGTDLTAVLREALARPRTGALAQFRFLVATAAACFTWPARPRSRRRPQPPG